MSLYQVQKFLYEVNQNPERRADYRADAAKFAERFELSEEEKAALLSVDIRRLYQFGVHPLLLRPFTLLHKVTAQDYAKALAGLE
jgi:hypothetical protein